MPEAVIVSTARSPIGRAHKGSLTQVRPDDLAATIIRAALDKVPSLDPTLVEDIMLGIRMRDGLHAGDFAPDVVATLHDEGLIEVGERIRLTRSGRLLANRVIERLSEADRAGVT